MILDRLRGKKKTKENDVARNEMVSDAETILRILRGCLHFGNVPYSELRQIFYRNKGMCGEGRLFRALVLLKNSNVIGFGGHKGDGIHFNKKALPTKLIVLSFGDA